jgi:hypothetical protein
MLGGIGTKISNGPLCTKKHAPKHGRDRQHGRQQAGILPPLGADFLEEHAHLNRSPSGTPSARMHRLMHPPSKERAPVPKPTRLNPLAVDAKQPRAINPGRLRYYLSA